MNIKTQWSLAVKNKIIWFYISKEFIKMLKKREIGILSSYQQLIEQIAIDTGFSIFAKTAF